ncbi:MAG: hypothetical protein ACI35O_11975 [Bacillaceae bacterium]
MIRNNSVALLIHGVLGIIFWFILDQTSTLTIHVFGWTNDFITYGIPLLITVLAISCYYFLGKFLLVSQPTKMKDMLSVSVVSVIGLFIWIYCYFFSDGHWDWFLYLFYNTPFWSLMQIMPSSSEHEVWIVLVAFLPSIIFWLSIKKDNAVKNSIHQM